MGPAPTNVDGAIEVNPRAAPPAAVDDAEANADGDAEPDPNDHAVILPKGEVSGISKFLSSRAACRADGSRARLQTRCSVTTMRKQG